MFTGRKCKSTISMKTLFLLDTNIKFCWGPETIHFASQYVWISEGDRF